MEKEEEEEEEAAMEVPSSSDGEQHMSTHFYAAFIFHYVHYFVLFTLS